MNVDFVLWFNVSWSVLHIPYIVVAQSLSCIWLFETPWKAACQTSLSFTSSQSLFKLMSIQSVMPFKHLKVCCPLLLTSIVPSIRVFSNESELHIRWPEYWSFSFSTSPSNEYSGLISFRIDWFDLLVVQRTLKEFSPASQFESIDSSVLNLFYGPTLTSIHDHWEKTIALTIWTFVSKVVSLFFNMLSRFVITFLPRSKCLLISWRQPLQMLVHWIPIAFLVIYFLIQGNYNSLCSEGFPKESNHIRLDVICI